MPDKSPPAAPVGAAPVMVTLVADVILPCASTISCDTCVEVPYAPAATPLLAIFAAVTEPLARSAVAMVPSVISPEVTVPSVISALVTEFAARVGLG